MQLNTILHITGELLREQGEGAADASTNPEALLPFAAVLSGAFSLLAPDQVTSAASAAGTEASVAEAEGGAIAAGSTPAGLSPLGGLVEGQAGHSDALLDASRPTPSQLPTADRPEAAARPTATAFEQTVASQRAEGVDRVVGGVEASSESQPIPAAVKPTTSTTARQAASDVLAGKQDVPQASGDTLLQPEGARPVDPVAQAGREVAAEEAASGEDAHPEKRDLESRDQGGRQREVGRQVTRQATDAFPRVHTTRTGRSAEPVSTVGRQRFEQQPNTEGIPAEASSAAAEVDGLLPDAENEMPTGKTDAEGRAEEKATAGRLAAAGTSADAGDEADAQDADTSRRQQRARRAEAASPRARAMEPSAPEAAPEAEYDAVEAEVAAEAMPHKTEEGFPAAPESDPDGAMAEVLLARTDAEKATEASEARKQGPRRAFSSSRTVSAAWLRAALSNARQTVFSEDGWKMLEMNLDGGEGTVTIKARREEGRVSVAVGFSDPDLRALASAHADRLQEVLQAEYETTVDFSLFNSNAGHSEEREQAGGTPAPATAGGAQEEVAVVGTARPTLPPGARHEWVG